MSKAVVMPSFWYERCALPPCQGYCQDPSADLAAAAEEKLPLLCVHAHNTMQCYAKWCLQSFSSFIWVCFIQS